MRGGKREGAGRKALPRAEFKTSLDKFLWIIEELHKHKTREQLGKESGQLKHWRTLTEAKELRIRLDSWKFLYDHAYGKATQPVESKVTGVVEVNLNTNVKMPKFHE